MVPTTYTGKAQPAIVKKKRAEIAHVQAPLMGLSMATKLSSSSAEATQLTATILSNFNIEEDGIRCRAGYKIKATRGTAPVWHLIPWYGTPNAIAAASNGELWDAQSGNRLKGGFTSNNWHWTSFSNLGEYDYTVMVNGADGVWSWNGSLADDIHGDIPVTSLTSANPAVATVASTAGIFTVGQIVQVSGAAGPGTVKANGYRTVTAMDATTVTLNVDTMIPGTPPTAGPPQTSGVKINPTSGLLKEDVTSPAGETWVSPLSLNIVVSHMNRLFFADTGNLAIYYLPIQQKSGELELFPLNAIFRRGGSIRAMATWSVDGGNGMDDLLVIFSSNGECVIYSGTDPATNFKLVGRFDFDAPMSKHAITRYGGELYVLISTGLVPMSTMLKAESDQLGQSEKGVTTLFYNAAVSYRSDVGWSTFLNPSSGRLYCNTPQGANNRYKQFIRHMPKAIWSTWDGVPARCWGWLDPIIYFGDDSGNVYEMHPSHLNDNGKAIRVDVQMAWNSFKTPAKKTFMAIQTYITTDGAPQPVIDIKTEYDFSEGINQPDLSTITDGSYWDEDPWAKTQDDPPDGATWATGERAITIWNGVAGRGRVGAIRMTHTVQNSTFAIKGWEVIYEAGTLI